jgi:hypothetical protein
MTDDYPVAYRGLAERFGAPVSVEDARRAWSHVVKAAEQGTAMTLIAPGGPGRGGWAAVVPLSEVADPGRCPVWAVSEARDRLGDVVNAAGGYLDPVPQVLARHRQPVAAVVAAGVLERMPADGERIDVRALLEEEGGKVAIEFEPGESGAVDDEGDVLFPPEPSGYVAVAFDWQGTEIGSGGGGTPAEALLHIRRKPPAGSGGPWAGVAYSDEPPF